MSGNQLDYKILSVLGEGGSSRVYLAEDKNMHQYALKQVLAEYMNDGYYCTLIEQEIQVMQRL